MNVALPAFNILSLFSGIGGLDLALKLAVPNARTILYVEREVPAAAILVARMESGELDAAPIRTDLATFDAKPLCGAVDCLTAGAPCQPYSVAGKRQGDRDARWLWAELFRIADECAAASLFLENVPGLVTARTIFHRRELRDYFGTLEHAIDSAETPKERWYLSNHGERLHRRLLATHGISVLLYLACELESRDYQTEAGLFSAAECGAPQKRERLFVLAYRHDGFGRTRAALRAGWDSFAVCGNELEHANSAQLSGPAGRRNAIRGGRHRDLVSEIESWTTPKAMSGGPNSNRMNRKAGGPDLQEQAQMWSTPNSNPDAPNGGLNRGNGQERPRLTSQCLTERAQDLTDHWPTPASRDYKGDNSEAHLERERERERDGKNRNHVDQLPNFVTHRFLSGLRDRINMKNGKQSLNDGRNSHPLWATPKASMAENGNDSGSVQRLEQGANPGLKDQAKNWPTPSASMMTPADQQQAMFAGTDPNRPKYSEANWMTPRGNGESGDYQYQSGDHGKKRPTLSGQANWSTPTGEDSEQSGAFKNRETLSSLTKDGKKKKLNSRFVCWLMGVHPDWTSLEPINSEDWAIWLSQRRALLHSLLSPEGQG